MIMNLNFHRLTIMTIFHLFLTCHYFQFIAAVFSLNIFYFIIRDGIGQKLYNIMIALSL